MSYYEDERQRRRSAREAARPDDYDDDYYTSRGPNRTTTLVKRRNSIDDVDEEITREFSPPSGSRGAYVRETTIRKGSGRPQRARSFDKDRYSDDQYDDDRYAGHRSDRHREDNRDHNRHRRRHSDTSSRSSSRGANRAKVTQALSAAVLAGVGEAYRARKEPGGLTGEKGKRIATAAFSAGGVDGLINYGKDPTTHQIRDTLGAAIAGMATSRIVNGPRAVSRERAMATTQERGRSSSRSGVRSAARSHSRYSDDSRSPSRSRSRRRSVSQAAAKGLAAVGLAGAANKIDPNRGHDQQLQRSSRRRYSDESSDEGDDRRNRAGGYSLDYHAHKTGDPDTDSDSSLGSSSGEEKERKKGKRKLLITTGLASIATIHAGHSVYQSYEKRHARIMAVKEGRISAEQAKKNQTKDHLNELASVGLAAIGIKGAYSEWKEMRDHRKEFNEELEKLKRHHEKRENRRKKYDALKRRGYADSGYATSLPDLHSAPPLSSPPGGWNEPFDERSRHQAQIPYSAGGVRPNAPQYYYDDNPYSGMDHMSGDHASGSPYPHPPVGPDSYDYPRPTRRRSPSRGRSVR